jgi:flavin-dependent dehydrogenase
MYDAIVVGARCAGSPAATLLARQGLRVLVVDRARFPSDVISTHFLWPHGASYLNRWGVLDRVLASTPSSPTVKLCTEGITLEGAAPIALIEQHFRQLHGDARGVVQTHLAVRRRVLDEILVDAARTAGAEVREEFAVEELVFEGDQVVGIRGRSRGGDVVEERARVVIGADGRNSFVARALGLRKFDERARCTFAYWSYFSGFSLPQPQIHRRGRLSVAVVPTNFGHNMTLVWGPAEWFQSFRRDIAGNHQLALDYVCPEIGALVRAQGRREERFYGTADQAGYLRPLHGPGWVLVGDAQCFKDQCTAMGMTHAFRDAELLAKVLGDALAAGRPLTEALRSYEARRRSQSAAAYYDYVCTLAQMKLLRHDELLLLVALRSNQVETDRYIAMHADIAPVADFFSASNLFQLSDGALERTRDHEVFRDFEAGYRARAQNPFEQTERPSSLAVAR